MVFFLYFPPRFHGGLERLPALRACVPVLSFKMTLVCRFCLVRVAGLTPLTPGVAAHSTWPQTLSWIVFCSYVVSSSPTHHTAMVSDLLTLLTPRISPVLLVDLLHQFQPPPEKVVDCGFDKDRWRDFTPTFSLMLPLVKPSRPHAQWCFFFRQRHRPRAGAFSLGTRGALS